jgi:hypothetical protein
MDDLMLMMGLSRSYDTFLAKSSRLEIFRHLGLDNPEVQSLQWDCWMIRREAYQSLAKIYDTSGDETFLRYWGGKFGWTFEQLGKSSLRSWLCKDAADYSDPNPVEAEHVYLLMSKNFPPDAIGWVKRARWTGPVQVPWERIDTDSKDSWAASHQPERVKEFQVMMQAHRGRVAPSILVQEAKSPKAFIVDGHHRALAHENLKQPVLAYLGNIDPKDRMAAEETHSKQIHSGTDPQNM